MTNSALENNPSPLYQRLQEKETEELLAIWQENDRQAWTDEAFEAIEKILIERLGKLPPQDDFVEDAAGGEEISGGYPADKRLIWLADAAHWLAPIVLFMGAARAALKLVEYFMYMAPGGQLALDFNLLIYIASGFDALIYAGFAYLVLQGISEVIYLLMDIREMVQPEDVGEEMAS